MRRRMMKSKVHRATVTAADLNYVGSISLDPALMERADIREWEQVAVLDIDNGARFETYAILGDSDQVQLNGAAARLVHPGDKVIIITYADYEDAELEGFQPIVVHVDEGPGRVNELIALGAMFDRDPDGALQLAREGGHSHARVVHAGGAATGAEIERALVDAVRLTAAAVMEHWFAVDVIVEGGRCRGVVAVDGDGSSHEVRAAHTLLAS